METNTNTQSQFRERMMYVLSLQCGSAELGALSGRWRSVQRKWQGTDEGNNFLATFGARPLGMSHPHPPVLRGGGAIRSLSGAGVVMTAGWWPAAGLYRLHHEAGRVE